MAVDDLVELRMAESDCAVILATADDEVSGYWQPRPNVMHEIALAREKLDNEVISSKQHGCEFPSERPPEAVGECFSGQYGGGL